MLAWEALCGTKRIGWERRGGHTLGFLESMFGMWSLGEKCHRWSELSELLARSESSRCQREFPVSSNRKLVLCIMSEKKFWCLAYCLEKWKVEGKKKKEKEKRKWKSYWVELWFLRLCSSSLSSSNRMELLKIEWNFDLQSIMLSSYF